MTGSAAPIRSLLFLLALLGAIPPGGARAGVPPGARAKALPSGPIITRDLLAGWKGDELAGPSLIRVPSWVKNPLGKYYLYFAHPDGKVVHFAFADRLEGPWTVRAEGVFRLEDQAALTGFLAAPQAVVDERARKILLFHQGRRAGAAAEIAAAVAESADGVNFVPRDTVVGPADLRVFGHEGRWYALDPTGDLRVSDELGRPFTRVADIIGDDIVDLVGPEVPGGAGAPSGNASAATGRVTMRHIGVDVVDGWLLVYFSCAGDRPERIFCTAVELAGPPAGWKARWILEILRPPPSRGLRDPAIVRDGTERWLVYAIAGEASIGLAEIEYLVPE